MNDPVHQQQQQLQQQEQEAQANRERRAREARDVLNLMIRRYGDERPEHEGDFIGDDENRRFMANAREMAEEMERLRDNPPHPVLQGNQQMVIEANHLRELIREVRGDANAPGGAGAAAAAGDAAAGGAAAGDAVAGGAAAGGAAAGAYGHQRIKIEKFETADGADWRTWRDHIQMAILETNLFPGPEGNHDRAKRNIKLHIYGKAARLTRDIHPKTAAEAELAEEEEETYNDFLDRLQARFLPMAAQLASQQAFEMSKQKDNESVGEFHSRLISEFLLAYPNARDVNHDPHLIRRFKWGLKDASVQLHVMQNSPQNYDECLRLAEERYACLGAVQQCHRGGGGRIHAMELYDAESINAMDKRTMTSTALANQDLRRGKWPNAPIPNVGGKKCWTCGSEYHLKADCQVPALADRSGRRPLTGGKSVEEMQAMRRTKRRVPVAVGAGRGGRSGSRAGSRDASRKRVTVIEPHEQQHEETDPGTQFIATMHRTGGTNDQAGAPAIRRQ